MTLPIQRDPAVSRKAALAKARQSRRPSRLGKAAGAAGAPDFVVAVDAGFPGLLKHTWQQAVDARDLPAAVETLLTLGGHVPADVQLRALRLADECALKVLFGRSWRTGDQHTPAGDGEQTAAFLGEIGLTTGGRVVVRVPSAGPLPAEEDLVGGVLRVSWTGQALRNYQTELKRLTTRYARSAADCRDWLTAAGQSGRHDMLENLKEAARRTAPFVLYQEGKRYTNFRDRNTLTGKTLWPGHPDCLLSSLQHVPIELWSDADVVAVACLALLVRSAGFARIEEANGTQLTLDHVACLLERTRVKYNAVPGGQPVHRAASTRIAALDDLARSLRRRRRYLTKAVQLYREIHGPLMHKIEQVAGPAGTAAARRETDLCTRLTAVLPVTGRSLAELGASVAAGPGWLAEPHGEFGSGLESLVYQTVRAAATAFDSDFAMSRGIRSLSALTRELRAERWAEITTWDLPHFFCCVVPAPGARRYYEGSSSRLADMAWAISSRMQYNSWHFLVGNLPKVPQVVARDYFVPPTMPDIAFFSDQHHHGHVAARVRFSIRSPQAVEVLGRTFDGFIDLRLLRCAGVPFGEQDLLAAHRTSAFIAKATGLAAVLAAGGRDVEVRSFDSQWHWAKVTG